MVDEKNAKTKYSNSWTFSWTKQKNLSSLAKTQIGFYHM
jgi:hypothetical protein